MQRGKTRLRARCCSPGIEWRGILLLGGQSLGAGGVLLFARPLLGAVRWRCYDGEVQLEEGVISGFLFSLFCSRAPCRPALLGRSSAAPTPPPSLYGCPGEALRSPLPGGTLLTHLGQIPANQPSGSCGVMGRRGSARGREANAWHLPIPRDGHCEAEVSSC